MFHSLQQWGAVESMEVFLTPNKFTVAQSSVDLPGSCLG